MGLRLGFYYHIPALEIDGTIRLPGYLGRFIDSLASYCEELTLFLHVPNLNEKANFDYPIQGKNITLVSLEKRGSVVGRFLTPWKFTRVIHKNTRELDALLIRGPSPLLPTIAKVVRPIPIILLIVGDYLAGIDTLNQPIWRKELIRIWEKNNFWRQLEVASTSLTFVNSRRLYVQFEKKVTKLFETHTTTLNKDDFYIRSDTCVSLPVKLLYTGRMDRAKGLLDIISAISILINQGDDVLLDLVGWSEKESTILDEIFDLASKKNIADRVYYHGYKPVGPELFAFYKEADIYVLASQSSFEGFPRTIWEAMAHSLPVVTTKVGSIPDFISGSAELVDPKDPAELAAGISRLIHNSKLRQDYIAKGLILAYKNSLEDQVGEMARVITEWVESQHV